MCRWPLITSVQCIYHRMIYMNLLRSVALPCNIKITYVTFKRLNGILVPMLSTLRHGSIFFLNLTVLMLLWGGF